MSTNEQDLRALAYLAQRLRADTQGAGKWDDAGLWPVLKRFEGHNLALTIERVTRHAQDPEARTPAAMERPFVPGPPTAGAKYPLRAGDPDECRTHQGQHRDHCSGCHADQLVTAEPTYGIDPMDADTNGLGDDATHAYDGLTGRELFQAKREELDLRRALEPPVEVGESA